MSTTAAASRHPNTVVPLSAFLAGVRTARRTNGAVLSPAIRAAATTFANEGVGDSGGFLVPADFNARLVDQLLGEAALLPRTLMVETTKNAIGVPVDPDPGYSTTGPQAGEPSEGEAIGQSKLRVALRSLRLSRLDVFLPLSNELVEDGGPELEASIADIVARKLDFKINSILITGSGVGGESLGWLNSPGTITVAAEGAQGAGTLNYTNCSKLWDRLLPSARPSACWIVGAGVERAMREMVGPVGSPPGLIYNGTDAFPRLFGAPVLQCEAAPALGSAGDVSLVGLRGVLVAHKPGLTKRSISTHCLFDTDAQAWRFSVRIASQLMLSAPAAQLHGGSTLSTAVQLVARP